MANARKKLDVLRSRRASLDDASAHRDIARRLTRLFWRIHNVSPLNL